MTGNLSVHDARGYLLRKINANCYVIADTTFML